MSYKPTDNLSLVGKEKPFQWEELHSHIRNNLHVPEKVIIFDLFGVVVDYAAAHAFVFKEIFSELGIHEERFRSPAFLRQNPQTILSTIYAEKKISNDSLVEYVQKSFEMVKSFIIERPDGAEIKASRWFIEYLRSQNIRIALVSAAPRFLIDAVLNKIGLTRAFYAVFSGDDPFFSKSDAEFYRLILNTLHEENAENCFVLDDLKEGIVAAKSVGMKTIALRLRGGADTDWPGDFVAKSFRQVRDYIDNELRLRAI
jgi:HAD superfamily hydrolase (TIGR01509 family)